MNFWFLCSNLNSSCWSNRILVFTFSNSFDLIQIINIDIAIISTSEENLSFAHHNNSNVVYLLFMICEILKLNKMLKIPNENSSIFTCRDYKLVAKWNSYIINKISVSMEHSLKASIRQIPNLNKSTINRSYLSSAPVRKNREVQSKQTAEMEAGLVS